MASTCGSGGKCRHGADSNAPRNGQRLSGGEKEKHPERAMDTMWPRDTGTARCDQNWSAAQRASRRKILHKREEEGYTSCTRESDAVAEGRIRSLWPGASGRTRAGRAGVGERGRGKKAPMEIVQPRGGSSLEDRHQREREEAAAAAGLCAGEHLDRSSRHQVITSSRHRSSREGKHLDRVAERGARAVGIGRHVRLLPPHVLGQQLAQVGVLLLPLSVLVLEHLPVVLLPLA